MEDCLTSLFGHKRLARWTVLRLVFLGIEGSNSIGFSGVAFRFPRNGLRFTDFDAKIASDCRLLCGEREFAFPVTFFLLVFTNVNLDDIVFVLDDIVFVVFLYQRWVYRVDMSRVNEFGHRGDGEPAEDDAAGSADAAAGGTPSKAAGVRLRAGAGVQAPGGVLGGDQAGWVSRETREPALACTPVCST